MGHAPRCLDRIGVSIGSQRDLLLGRSDESHPDTNALSVRHCFTRLAGNGISGEVFELGKYSLLALCSSGGLQ